MNEAQHSAWETIQRGHAIANGVYVVVVNRVGHEGKLTFWGQSFVADPFRPHHCESIRRSGRSARGRMRSLKIEETRQNWPFLRDRRIDAYDGLRFRFGDRYELRPAGFIGNIGVVMLMITYLMLQLNKLPATPGLLASERNRREPDRHFTALRLQSLRSADGSVLGSDQFCRDLSILPTQGSQILKLSMDESQLKDSGSTRIPHARGMASSPLDVADLAQGSGNLARSRVRRSKRSISDDGRAHAARNRQPAR
jgi:hypothetical protein